MQQIAQAALHDQIKENCEDGLKVKEIEGKGRGVCSTKPFSRGDFVCEYKGDLLDLGKAKERETNYSRLVLKTKYRDQMK